MLLFGKGYGEIIAAAILFSFAGIFAKAIVGMGALSTTFYRVFFALLIFSGVLLATGKAGMVRLKADKARLVLTNVMLIATFVLFFVAVTRSTVASAILLLYTAPAYVAALSAAFLKERLTKKLAIALIVALTGVVLIAGPEKIDLSSQYSLGLLAGLASGITYALKLLLSKGISRTYNGFVQAFWGMVIGTLVLLPFAFVPLSLVLQNSADLVLWAIFPTILAVSLQYNALRKVKASSASIIALIEPVSAVVLSVTILGERLTAMTMAGGALILLGAFLAMRR